MQLTRIFRDARLAQEMFTQLIEKLDQIRGEAVQKIESAKENAIINAEKIGDLVSKSSNSYLAADFEDIPPIGIDCAFLM